MSRRTRIYYDHAVYHISIRGNNRQQGKGKGEKGTFPKGTS
ncbi:MAG: hypothetical protein WC628_09315 [Candidatus Omnitrophota bacterium]